MADSLMKTQIIEKDIIINIRGEYEEGRLLITVDDTSRNYDIRVIVKIRRMLFSNVETYHNKNNLRKVMFPLTLV